MATYPSAAVAAEIVRKKRPPRQIRSTDASRIYDRRRPGADSPPIPWWLLPNTPDAGAVSTRTQRAAVGNPSRMMVPGAGLEFGSGPVRPSLFPGRMTKPAREYLKTPTGAPIEWNPVSDYTWGLGHY